ncbi:PduO protein [Marinobacterium zhoushanense]|uniref:PduO protein n=1 Tax=Marinobacterium zhoushanense TaxID=1679163 RepID=A0ABQ1KKH9_9GAMM|nr:heme-binding protein [Marinobacterium zhoushanense]GGC03045.1 PduO protein [Marinobacterium zhoushanense]
MRLSNQINDQLLARAREAASRHGCTMSIAVCDAGGHLLQFCRMDGAFAGSADIAMRKANCAAMFNAPSHAIGDIVRNHTLTGFELSNGGLMLFGGGLPICIDGELVGAIGVSGGSAEQDIEVARDALEGLV